VRLVSIQTGVARPLTVGGRRLLSAIGKTPVSGPVSVGALGLGGDEQADLSVHGGLDKAVYAYPIEHLPYWRDLRRENGVTLFDGPLPFGFVGENLSLEGLLEHQVWIGDELVFPGCTLRVTAPREPCAKFNAVTGLRDAGRRMVERACSGWYLAVARPGSLEAGQPFTLRPGPRGMTVAQAFLAKRAKHIR
jgi:MOSC domain-containing protein YiiM